MDTQASSCSTTAALLGSLLAALVGALPVAAGTVPLPGRFAGEGIVIGLEYAGLDNARLVRGMAEALAETGLPGMKHYAEAVQWGAMQTGPDRPIDFGRMDLFVREYQRQGFTELTLCLKPHSRWASVDVGRLRSTNASPRPEYRGLFRHWVRAVVERYDGDGRDDMPGLRWPVRYVEIGNELSSYEPEPVEEYLVTLRLAYEAAHAAAPDVRVGHAAFLLTPVDMDVHAPADYEGAWGRARRVDTHHGLEDMRAILDHPELFDVVNLHSLGAPYEIEHVMRWLAYETGRRGYRRDVIVSDTLPTSYVGWGPATTCKGKVLGVLAAPATEADRCRLAEYFTALVEKEPKTLAWTRGFVAADHVQRAVVAAEQGVRLINLAFAGDVTFMTLPAFRAGGGISAWGGALRVSPLTGAVQDRYPAFYAIRQLVRHLAGYRSIERLEMADQRARVYRLEGRNGPAWIAWRDPRAVLLPADGEPSMRIGLEVGSPTATVERVITQMGRSEAERRRVDAVGGRVDLELTHAPVYVVPR